MRSLLSERDYRIVLILEILMATEWVSLTTMTEYLDCSEKTIRNDLGLISTEFKEIIIESSPQLGYRLIRQNKYPIENTVDEIINNALIFQLLQILLKNSKLKLTELESLLFVSANSIRNTIRHFNNLLNKDDISIKSRPFRIQGNEVKITSLFFIRLQQSYFSRKMSEDQIFSFIQELTPLLFKENTQLEKVFKNDQHSLNFLLYIRFFREINGHSYKKKNPKTEINYQLVTDKKIAKKFQTIFKMPLDNTIINRTVNFILDENIAFNYLQLIYLFDHSNDFRDIHNSLNKIMCNMTARFNLESISTKELKEIILQDNLATINRSNNYEIHFVILEILKYEQNKIFAEKNSYKDKTFYDNVILIQLAYFLQCNCPTIVKKIKPLTYKMSVTVLLAINKNSQILFNEYLTYHFDYLIDFTFIDHYDNNLNSDLLITNTYDYIKKDFPVLNIASLPNSQLYSDILSLLYDYRINQYINYSSNVEHN